MAHVAKVKSSGVAPMVGHYAREAEARGYERDNIDKSRTRFNYEIRSGSEPLAAEVRWRVSEAVRAHEEASGKALRKDANVMMDWVVTLPKDCPEERAAEFFTATVNFIADRYGAENVPGGFVHMDETTPHVHVPVVPVRDGKLQASKVVNRRDLQTFHKDLSAAVDDALGFHVSVELGEDQKGAKQLSALSQDEYKAAKDELAAAKAEAVRAREEACNWADAASQAEYEVGQAEDRLEYLQQQEEATTREIEELERAVAKSAEPKGLGLGIKQNRVFDSAHEAARLAQGLDRECGAAIVGSLKGSGVPEVSASRVRSEQARARAQRAGAAISALRERLNRCREVFVGLARRVMSFGIFSKANRELAARYAPKYEVPSLDSLITETAAASRALNQERHETRQKHAAR